MWFRFLNGRLCVTENLIDKHCDESVDKVAFIWEQDEPNKQQSITFGCVESAKKTQKYITSTENYVR